MQVIAKKYSIVDDIKRKLMARLTQSANQSDRLAIIKKEAEGEDE